MLIANYKSLARNPLRRKILQIAEAGLQAIAVEDVVQKRCRLCRRGKKVYLSVRGSRTKLEIPLHKYRRVALVGIGKGSALAIATLSKILGKYLNTAIALDIRKPRARPPKVRFFTGSHPLPSPRNVAASRRIIKLAQGLGRNDLLLTFICGGGSALFCGSAAELKYASLVFPKLTQAGADIFQLNTVRKHLSPVKGGGFARLAYPATVVSLIVSDVPGDNLSTIASGPTVFDATTRQEAEEILRQHGLYRQTKSALNETPKDKSVFRRVRNVLFLSNDDALSAMARKARQLRLRPQIASRKLAGEARKVFVSLLKKARAGRVVLAGGETTVTLKNAPRKAVPGKGGRNTEAVLGALSACSRRFAAGGVVITSIASDGRDNAEAAGALADCATLEAAKRQGLHPEDFLRRHDSFHFFAATGDLLFLKEQTFNVADFMLALAA
jgi:glycerate-2-kinase